MSLIKQKILGIQITASSKEKVLEELEKYLFRRDVSDVRVHKNIQKPCVIATPNPEQLVLASRETRFAKLLNRADIALPDGIGIVWASRILYGTRQVQVDTGIAGRIPGVEIMQDLVRVCAARGVRIGLIGSRAGLAEQALECLQATYPKLRGWALEPEHTSMAHMVRKIQQTRTSVVFVGLGAPKQEYFIEELRTQLPKLTHPIVYMSVGGSFDILSGSIQRAPVIIRKVGMEWLWRLVNEPWRWKRQLKLIAFVVLALKEKIRKL